MASHGRSLAALLAFAATCAAAPAAAAAPIPVNTTVDELNADGDCSLREAVRSANLDTAVDVCAAGNGTDTITIPVGTYSTGNNVTLEGPGENAAATGDLDLTSAMTIQGAGEGSDPAANTIID